MSSNINVKNIESNQKTNIGLPFSDVMICDNEIIASYTINDKLEKLVQNDLYVERRLQTANIVTPGPDLSSADVYTAGEGYKIWSNLSGDDNVQVLQKIDTPISATVVHDLDGVNVNFIVQYAGRFLAGTSNGLFMSDDSKSWYKPESNVLDSLDGREVNCFFQNPNFLLQPGIFSQFQYYVGIKKTSAGDTRTSIYALQADLEYGNPVWIPVPGQADELSATVNFINYAEDEARLFVGTAEGLYYIDKDGFLIKDEFVPVANDMVECLSLNDGRYIIATDNGLLQSRDYVGLKGSTQHVQKPDIVAVCATDSRIYFADPVNLYFSSYDSLPDEGNTIVANLRSWGMSRITSLVYNDGILYIGTHSGVYYYVEGTTGITKIYNASDGYSSIETADVNKLGIIQPSGSSKTYLVAAAHDGVFCADINEPGRQHKIFADLNATGFSAAGRTIDVATASGYRQISFSPAIDTIEKSAIAYDSSSADKPEQPSIAMMKAIDIGTDSEPDVHYFATLDSAMYEYKPSTKTFKQVLNAKVQGIVYHSGKYYYITPSKLCSCSTSFTDITEILGIGTRQYNSIEKLDQFIVTSTKNYGFVYYDTEKSITYTDKYIFGTETSSTSGNLVNFKGQLYTIFNNEISGLSSELVSSQEQTGVFQTVKNSINDIVIKAYTAIGSPHPALTAFVDSSSGRTKVLSSTSGTSETAIGGELSTMSIQSEADFATLDIPVTAVAKSHTNELRFVYFGDEGNVAVLSSVTTSKANNSKILSVGSADTVISSLLAESATAAAYDYGCHDTLYIGTNKGIYSLDSTYSFIDESSSPEGVNNIIFAEGIGSAGMHLVATDNGLWTINNDGHFVKLTETGIDSKKIYDIVCTDGNTVSAYTDSGFYVSDSTASSLAAFQQKYSGNIVDSTFDASPGKTLFLQSSSTAGESKIIEVSGDSSTTHALTLVSFMPTQIEAFGGSVFLGGTDGLYKNIEQEEGSTTSRYVLYLPVNGLSYQRISSMAQAEGKLFVASDRGLFIGEHNGSSVTFSNITGGDFAKLNVATYNISSSETKTVILAVNAEGIVYEYDIAAKSLTQLDVNVKETPTAAAYLPLPTMQSGSRALDSFGNPAKTYFFCSSTAEKSSIAKVLINSSLSYPAKNNVFCNVNKLTFATLDGERYILAATSKGIYCKKPTEAQFNELCEDLSATNVLMATCIDGYLYALTRDYAICLQKSPSADASSPYFEKKRFALNPSFCPTDIYAYADFHICGSVVTLGSNKKIWQPTTYTHLAYAEVEPSLAAVGHNATSLQNVNFSLVSTQTTGGKTSDRVDYVDSLFIFGASQTQLYTVWTASEDPVDSYPLSSYEAQTLTRQLGETDIFAGQAYLQTANIDNALFFLGPRKLYELKKCDQAAQLSTCQVAEHTAFITTATRFTCIADFGIDTAIVGSTVGLFTEGTYEEMVDTTPDVAIKNVAVNDVLQTTTSKVFARATGGLVNLNNEVVGLDGKDVLALYRLGNSFYASTDPYLYQYKDRKWDNKIELPTFQKAISLQSANSKTVVGVSGSGVWSGTSFDLMRNFLQPYNNLAVVNSTVTGKVNKIYYIDDLNLLFGLETGLKYYKDGQIVRSYPDGIDGYSPMLGNVQNIQGFSIDDIDTATEKQAYVLMTGGVYEMDEKYIFSSQVIDLAAVLEVPSLVVNQIIKKDSKTYIFATSQGIYSTSNQFTWKENIDSFDIRELSTNIGNAYQDKLSSVHEPSYHTADDVIPKLQSKLDVRLENIPGSFTSVKDTGVETVIHNDIVESVEFNGRVQYIQAAVKNWYTDTNVGDKFDSEGYVNKYEIDSEFKVDLYNISYIIKNWRSGLKEIYIYLPTTLTFYCNHPEEIGKCRYSGQSVVRKNSLNSVVNSLDKAKTSVKLMIDNDHLKIASIHSIQINGNSLPLKIYKEDEDSCGMMTGLYHSVSQPSVSKDLFISKDGSWNNNVKSSLNESTDVLTLKFDVYGSDAQAIKIVATSYSMYQIEYNPGVAPDSTTPVTGVMPRQKVKANAYTQLDPCVFRCNGYVFNGWDYTIDGVTHHVENMAVVHDLPVKPDETVVFTATWAEYPFNAAKDTFITLVTDEDDSQANTIALASYKMKEGYNDIIADFNY